MGCDGLWDMLKNEQVRSAVKASFAKSQEDENLDRFVTGYVIMYKLPLYCPTENGNS